MSPSGLVWFGLVSLFNAISTFVGYLKPNEPLQKNCGDTILPLAGEESKVQSLSNFSESECYSATGVRTRLLRGRCPILHGDYSVTISWANRYIYVLFEHDYSGNSFFPLCTEKNDLKNLQTEELRHDVLHFRWSVEIVNRFHRKPFGRPAKSYIQQLCADTGCRHEQWTIWIVGGNLWWWW